MGVMFNAIGGDKDLLDVLEEKVKKKALPVQSHTFSFPSTPEKVDLCAKWREPTKCETHRTEGCEVGRDCLSLKAFWESMSSVKFIMVLNGEPEIPAKG
jgi:hypothetical protein